MLVIRNDTATQDVVANSFEDGKIDLAITRFWICPIFAQFQLIHPQWVFGFENLNKLGNISTWC